MVGWLAGWFVTSFQLIGGCFGVMGPHHPHHPSSPGNHQDLVLGKIEDRKAPLVGGPIRGAKTGHLFEEPRRFPPEEQGFGVRPKMMEPWWVSEGLVQLGFLEGIFGCPVIEFAKIFGNFQIPNLEPFL